MISLRSFNSCLRILLIGMCIMLVTTNAYSRSTPDPETFDTKDLIKWSFQGVADESCGGYCIIGLCAHLNITIHVGLTGGVTIIYTTLISPKIRHATPEFLVQAYNKIGKEPYSDWRDTFGAQLEKANAQIFGSVIAPFNGDGLQGGRPDPVALDHHQSNSYKEVDIIGHPLAILPSLLNKGTDSSANQPYKAPKNVDAPKSTGQAVVIGSNSSSSSTSSGTSSSSSSSTNPFSGINVNQMATAMAFLYPQMNKVQKAISVALLALKVVNTIQEIKKYVTYFKTIRDYYTAYLNVLQAIARGSIYANLANPRFVLPRLMCPNNIKPLEPYYLSFADFFYWRAGYPITDGPLTKEDHSADLIHPSNPNDYLPSSAASLSSTDPFWGQLYPREGFVNNNHDAKAASVDAWRAMDILLNSVPKGSRVGVEVKLPLGKSRKWQLIFPEILQCKDQPYYPSSPSSDFIRPHDYGSYAWNVYGQYECCSNDKGTLVTETIFPKPICLKLPSP